MMIVVFQQWDFCNHPLFNSFSVLDQLVEKLMPWLKIFKSCTNFFLVNYHILGQALYAVTSCSLIIIQTSCFDSQSCWREIVQITYLVFTENFVKSIQLNFGSDSLNIYFFSILGDYFLIVIKNQECRVCYWVQVLSLKLNKVDGVFRRWKVKISTTITSTIKHFSLETDVQEFRSTL